MKHLLIRKRNCFNIFINIYNFCRIKYYPDPSIKYFSIFYNVEDGERVQLDYEVKLFCGSQIINRNEMSVDLLKQLVSILKSTKMFGSSKSEQFIGFYRSCCTVLVI